MNGNYTIKITREAQKDRDKVKAVPKLKRKADELLDIIKNNPFFMSLTK